MAEPYSKIVARNKTPYDLGMERGMERGMEEGMETGAVKAIRDLAIALLESKFRSVPRPFMDRIDQLSQLELRELALKTPSASSIDELFPKN